MNLDVQWTCTELISALIEGGAQGALITGLIWGALRLWPRANAATRHGAWFATLLVVALLPAAHYGKALAQHWNLLSDPAVENIATAATPIASAYKVNFEESSEDEAAAEVGLSTGEPSQDSAIALPEETASAPALTQAPWRLEVPVRLSVVLVSAWLVLAVIRLGGIVSQLWALRSIKTRAIRATDSFVYAFARAVAGMGISRKPRLLISEGAAAPMVVGFFRPAMLLPRTIAERSTSGQLEHLFRHELAHLARRDDWTNLAQQVIAAILFFHPCVLFLSRRLTTEREIACDDHALAIGRAPREYALFLTEFASQMKGRDFTAAPAAWSSNSQLKERIGMILNGKRNASPRVSRAGVGAISATAVALGLTALIATPRFVVAAEDSAPQAPQAVAVEATVAPEVEVAVNVEPAETAAPRISVTPSIAPVGVSIASITTPPREKLPALRGQSALAPLPPVHPRLALAPQPEGAPDGDFRPHPKPTPRPERDGDIEKRLQRLEKLVEELANHEKRGPRNPDAFSFQNNFNSDQIRSEIERAHRDADRARHDAERAVREQKMAMESQMSSQRDQIAHVSRDFAAQQGGRESLKARRHALEAQRKQIDKELESLEREMKQQDEVKERHADKEREKRDKADEKEKKHREGGEKPDSDDEKAK